MKKTVQTEMRSIGIVCEVNPLHEGHRYLLSSARGCVGEEGFVVTVMSGNTVQRGELAVIEKYCRAEMLIACGADLVVELPAPFCCSSAEDFSRGAIAVLRHFCDGLIFGSECGDLDILNRAAEIASGEDFRTRYRELLTAGMPAAAAYYGMLKDAGVGTLSSNDLLGVEYLRAIKTLGASMNAQTVKRQGSGYADTEITEGICPSAMAIRRQWETDFESGLSLIAEDAREICLRAKTEGFFLDKNRADAAVIGALRLIDAARIDELEETVGDRSGVIRRLIREAEQATDMKGLIDRCATKRYTDAHLRRLVLACLFGMDRRDRADLPSYTNLLGVSAHGRALLSEHRKNDDFTVVTKAADAPADRRQTVLERRIDGFYYGLLERPRGLSNALARRPYVGQ